MQIGVLHVFWVTWGRGKGDFRGIASMLSSVTDPCCQLWFYEPAKRGWDSGVRNNLLGKLLVKTITDTVRSQARERKRQQLLEGSDDQIMHRSMRCQDCALAAKGWALSGNGSPTYHDGDPRKYDGRDELPDPAWEETQIRGTEILRPLLFHLPKQGGPNCVLENTPTQDISLKVIQFVILPLC